MAGSTPNLRNMSGITTPEDAAKNRLIIRAAAMTIPIEISLNQNVAIAATTKAHKVPFNRLTITSLLKIHRLLLRVTWPSAIPRMTSVMVWLPAMPPMLATTFIKIATVTTFSSVVSKLLTTQDAIKAVIKLIPSQMARRLLLGKIGANRSSSSFKPAILKTE